MKRLGGYALSILLLASLLLNGYFVLSKQKESTVVEVHDGDTFTLGNGDRVRLLGADTPEFDDCYAKESLDKLTSLLLHKSVRITEEKRDTYGRRMGLVYVGNTLVNDVMIREGFAELDYTPNSKSEQFKNLSKEAKERGIGRYSSACKSLSPTPKDSRCVIKSNIDKATGTRLYHLPKCRHYSQIVLDADRGEKFFCSENEAKAAGFTLAPDCLR